MSPLTPRRRRRASVAGTLLALLAWGAALPARTAAAVDDCALSCPPIMTPIGPLGCFDFTTATGIGTCGEVHNDTGGLGSLVKVLQCGGLDVGGGASAVAEGPTPDGATSRFCIVSCGGNACTLGPSTTSGPTLDCSAPGCFFGPPLPIPNAGTTTCTLNTWNAPGGGTLDVAAGTTSNLSVPLDSQIFLTGNALHPCPLCKVSPGMVDDPVCAGTPESPCTGVCELPTAAGVNLGGPNEGLPCVSTNSQGLSKDCPPGGADVAGGKPCNPHDPAASQCIFGVHLGVLGITLAPLATETVTWSDADGFFCPHQDPNDQEPGQLDAFPGCFGTTPSVDQTNLCRTITVHGSPAGFLLPPGTVKPMTLAAVFCIPRTGSLLVDLAAALPGPGAVTLPGTAVLGPPAAATTTTTTSTTSTTTTTLPAGCVDSPSFDSLLCRVDRLAALISQGGIAEPIAKTLLRLAAKARGQLEDAETRAASGDVRGARRKLVAAGRKLRVLARRVRSLAGRRAIPAPLRDQLAALTASIRGDARALAASF
jgi:hypothetical protein